MIVLNGTQYRLCLLDTNALSEMLKDPKGALRNFLLRFGQSGWIAAYSAFTLFELNQWDGLLDSFVEHFSFLPSILLKGHEQLHAEELREYPHPSRIDPALLAPSAIEPLQGQSKADALRTVFSRGKFAERDAYWKSERTEVLEAITSLVANFPARSGKYTARQVRQFMEVNVLQQLTMRFPDQVKAILQSEGNFEATAFRSICSMALTVFFKFYPDRRKPTQSDVFDIVISAALPYVDGVVTEKHQGEVIRRSTEFLPCLSALEVHTLEALR